ncbi:hypothetical protein IIA16_01465 [bacterium]|nr:hypothetical protein [bacterium]
MNDIQILRIEVHRLSVLLTGICLRLGMPKDEIRSATKGSDEYMTSLLGIKVGESDTYSKWEYLWDKASE